MDETFGRFCIDKETIGGAISNLAIKKAMGPNNIHSKDKEF